MFFPPIYSVLLGKQFTAVCYDVVCYIGRYTCTLGSIRYTPSKLGPVVQNKVHESLIEKKTHIRETKVLYSSRYNFR